MRFVVIDVQRFPVLVNVLDWQKVMTVDHAPDSTDKKKGTPGLKASVLTHLPPQWASFSRWGIGLVVCVALSIGGYYGWQVWSGDDSAAENFITAVAQRADIEDTVTATGTLQPKDFVDVGTQVSGQLKKLLVDIGAVVTVKQLLAEIDPSVYQSRVDGDKAQLLNLQAQLADRKAQLVLAGLQLRRQKNLDREAATTTEMLQSAAATQQSALAQSDAVKAQIKQTESTLRGDEASLGYTKIYAPIAGTVVSQTAKQGQTLNANQQAPIIMRTGRQSPYDRSDPIAGADY